METHLRENHAGSWTEERFPVLIDMSEGPLDETQVLACPMCPNELYLSRLLPHLADHMEEISLFVLPSVSDGDEDNGSQAIQAARTVDQTSMDSAASAVSLVFSAPDARERPLEYQQTLKELADSTPADSLSRAIAWKSALEKNSRKPMTLSGHTRRVWSVCFAPHGRLLASCSSDTTIRLWDPASGNLLKSLQCNSEISYSLVFSPDGRLLASGSSDCTIRLWDPATGSTLRTIEGHTGPVNSVAFSPDGRLLASGSMDCTLRLWDLTTGSPLQIFEDHTRGVYSVVFSPDGRLLASGSLDSTIRLWDPVNGSTLRTIEDYSDDVNSVAFSPDGELLASASTDRTVRLHLVHKE